MSVIKNGFNDYMDDETYHGDSEYLSSSVLKDILEDPYKLRSKRLGTADPEKPKAAFILGQHVHWKVLEPHREDAGFVEFGGASRNSKAYREFAENHAGKTIILRTERLDSEMMVESVENHHIAAPLFKDGEAEKTVGGEIEGIKLKVRGDYVKPNMIIDLKTTSYDLTPKTLRNIIYKRKYHLSAALYIDIFNQHLSEADKIKEFLFVFVNKKNGRVAVAKMTEKLIEEGRFLYHEAIDRYKELTKEKFFTNEYKEDIILIDAYQTEDNDNE